MRFFECGKYAKDMHVGRTDRQTHGWMDGLSAAHTCAYPRSDPLNKYELTISEPLVNEWRCDELIDLIVTCGSGN